MHQKCIVLITLIYTPAGMMPGLFFCWLESLCCVKDGAVVEMLRASKPWKGHLPAAAAVLARGRPEWTLK